MPWHARLLKYLARRGFEISSRSQFVFPLQYEPLLYAFMYAEPTRPRAPSTRPPCVNGGPTNLISFELCGTGEPHPASAAVTRRTGEHPPARLLLPGRRARQRKARMVSGLAIQVTCWSAARPSRLPISARVDRSGSERRIRVGRCARRIRFSAARYSFWSSSLWFTRPVSGQFRAKRNDSGRNIWQTTNPAF
jgi:hypothetical protein